MKTIVNIVELDPKWRNLLDNVWIEELDSTAFLTRCRLRLVTKSELREFAAQQYHYSRHFTRYLCALMMNLTSEHDRAQLADNLFEEVGLGEGGGVAHSIIYRNMLTAMKIDPSQVEVAPETKALIDTMLSMCADPDPMVGLGALCLGAEAIVPHIYSQIMRGFLSVGESPENLEFFRIHIDGDDAHAVTMRKIIDREIGKSPEKLQTLKKSAQLLISARRNFFAALSQQIQDQVPFDIHYVRNEVPMSELVENHV